MANINITSDAWTEIPITSGTVQNISATADIELSAEQTDNSGVVLKPSELYQWDNETIYARAVTEETGALRVVNFKRAAGGGGGYVLPVASSSTLGGVKVGSNLSIDESGVISTHAPYSLPTAAANTLGGVKIGSNVSIDENGVISVAAPYSLPTAAANTLGGVKVGSGLTITDGVLSATGGGGGGTSYSTTEQVVGSWIDGKPLYQKTYNLTTPATDNSREELAELPTNVNAGNVVYLSCILSDNTFGSRPLQYIGDLRDGYAVWIRGNRKITCVVANTAYCNMPLYVTLRYTKTTD